MVTGASSVTIRVGATGSLNNPLPPPTESPPVLPNSNSSLSSTQKSYLPFSYLTLLSSAYNPKPFKLYQGSSESSDAEIDKASKYIVKDSQDSMGKVGSVKFAKKSNKNLPPIADSTGEHSMVTQLSTTPVPKLRTHIPDVNKSHNTTDIERSIDLTINPPRSRTELKLDLKSVCEESQVSKDAVHIVSMTQKEGVHRYVNDNTGIKKSLGNKPPFRINNLSSNSTIHAEKEINYQNSMSDSLGSVEGSFRTVSLTSETTSKHEKSMHFKVENVNVSEFSKFSGQISRKPISHSRTSKSEQIGTSDPLHLELISKFTNSSVAYGNVPWLRKVKTKEPKTVKELFSDHKLPLIIDD